MYGSSGSYIAHIEFAGRILVSEIHQRHAGKHMLAKRLKYFVRAKKR